MSGEERRQEIIRIIASSSKPVSGTALARTLSVSRQVIVQDMALLRANGHDIVATNRGYVINASKEAVRVYKVIHREDQVEEEMSLIVDMGGIIADVFVYHRVYGVLRADLNVKSRLDIRNYIEEISNGKSTLLMNVTSGYHYHTVIADSEAILDRIQDELGKKGFLAKLQDYEPVNFWKNPQ